MLQTTNPFQHWRRITTDRKVEQTEPVRYPSKENTLGSSRIVVGKKIKQLTGRLLFSGLSGDSMVWQRDHQI